MSEEVKPQVHRIEVAAASVDSPSTDEGSNYRKMSPDQFKARLEDEAERGARRMLKSFGVDKEQRASYLEKIRSGEFVLAPKPKEGEPDYRAEYERLKAVTAETEKIKARADRYAELVKKQADEEFSKLPDLLQKEVVRRKIEDPESRLQEIYAMREAGLVEALVPKVAPTAPAEAKPATTMASPGPKQPGAEGQKNAYQQYEELRKVNKMAAANFAARYSRLIEETRPK